MTWEEEYGSMIGIVDTSYDQPRNADTVTRDIVTERQGVGTSTNDQWGGFFQKAIGSVLDYGIKRDAAQTGASLQAQQMQRARQPVYGQAASIGAGGITVSPMLLLLGGLVAFLVMKK